MTDQANIDTLIARWTSSVGGAERATYALFLSELCDILGVDHPNPAGADSRNDYTSNIQSNRAKAPTPAPQSASTSTSATASFSKPSSHIARGA